MFAESLSKSREKAQRRLEEMSDETRQLQTPTKRKFQLHKSLAGSQLQHSRVFAESRSPLSDDSKLSPRDRTPDVISANTVDAKMHANATISHSSPTAVFSEGESSLDVDTPTKLRPKDEATSSPSVHHRAHHHLHRHHSRKSSSDSIHHFHQHDEESQSKIQLEILDSSSDSMSSFRDVNVILV
jgi:hypothetical protein